jgi:hypothetical protein
MGWAIGYDDNWDRDIGYGVPGECDAPGCHARIDRGLGYVCGGQPYGGEKGCGLFFCGKHLFMTAGPAVQPLLQLQAALQTPEAGRARLGTMESPGPKLENLADRKPQSGDALEHRIEAADPELIKALMKKLEPTPDDGIIEGEIVEPAE